MTTLTYREWTKIKDLKFLDLQVRNFCQKLNILNLGWKPFKELYCSTDEKEHTLCPELCLKVAKNILGCKLYQELKETTHKEISSNQKYNRANCYLCAKGLKGAGKHGTIKNRNNPSFWSITSNFKILCLACIKKNYYSELEKEKRKTINKYIRRGYE